MNEPGPIAVALPQEALPVSHPRGGWGIQAMVLAVAILGGFLGILGSLIAEVQRGSGWTIILPIIIAAPVIEEALKPAGVYIALIKWPHALRNALHVGLLCAIGGLIFGLVESWVYVNVYVEDPGPEFIRFRYIVPVTMHVVCSFIFGLGLNRSIIDWANGRGRIADSTKRAYIAAVVIHGLYNLMAIALSIAGVLEFDEE